MEQGDLALAALAGALAAGVAANMHDRARARRLAAAAREAAGDAKGRPTVLMPGEVEEALVAAERAISGADDAPSPIRKDSGAPDKAARPAFLSRERVVLLILMSLLCVIAVVGKSLHFLDRWEWCFADEEGHIICAPTRRQCERERERVGGSTTPCQEPHVLPPSGAR
jgi:hypothetical protein